MITEVYSALKAGQELKNPGKWKKGQELTNLVGAVIAGLITVLRWKFPDLLIPDGMSQYAAEVIGTVLVMINLYLTRATTTKKMEL
ncbi:MAG: hypothetical protein ACOYB1_18630 [Limnohabitans sp.]